MHWFLIALLGPALWAASNHIDKYLLSKYSTQFTVMGLTIYSCIITVFILPFLFLLPDGIAINNLDELGIVVLGGFLAGAALYFYLLALKDNEASFAVPLFQIGPIFTLLLGYLMLGETLSSNQIIGGLLIICGAIILSLEFTSTKPQFKHQLFFLMFLSTILYVFPGVFFKSVAIENSFTATLFWEYVGFILFGAIFLCKKKYREELYTVFKSHKRQLLTLNITNEGISTIAAVAARFASLLVPIALVSFVNGLQPVFVFFYGILLTLFFPSISKESLLKHHIIQKILATFIIVVGTYILYLSY